MNAPLADRLRPQNLDEIAGQHHLLDQNRPLRRIIESGHIPNMVFYGPSGVGKTTLATIIAKKTNRTLRKLNGTTATTADIRNIVDELSGFGGINGILLYLDEIQYFNKKQQQTLLEFIENGSITPAYIQYLWVRQQNANTNNKIIYIPTEAGLPVLEAGRVAQKEKE